MNKKDLRAFIRMQKGMFSVEQLQNMSDDIIRHLMAHPRIKNANTILMYYSLDDECVLKDIDEKQYYFNIEQEE